MESRYAENLVEDRMDDHTRVKVLTKRVCLDWLRLKQENPSPDAIRPQGFPRSQRERRRPPLNAQQDFRCRVGTSSDSGKNRFADGTARIGHAVSSRKRVEIVAKAKQLGVKVTNAKARVTTES